MTLKLEKAGPVEDSFTLEEMARILAIKPVTLLNRMCARKDHPPFYRLRRPLFPKADALLAGLEKKS